MKKPIFFMVATAVCGLFTTINPALAQGTAFMYQGQLNADGAPANGVYDFEFSLYNNAAGLGNPIGSTLTKTGLTVANGFFNATLDFGDAFAGNATWLALFVRTNGAGNYIALTPLQELLPTPYAIFATTASNLSGTLPAAQVSGTIPAAQLPGTVVTNNESSVTLGNLTVTGAFTADGGGLTNLSAWQLSGNTGTTSANYLGTTDNQPLQIRVAGAQAGLITPNNGSPNIVFGPSANIINNGSAASSILGGSNNSVAATSSYSVIGGGSQNAISTGNDHTVIGGGFDNTIDSGANLSVLAGGTGNVIGPNAYNSVLSGGSDNVVFGDASYAVIGGGSGNQIQAGAYQSVIGGGGENAIYSDYGALGGGLDNEIQSGASFSAVGGGLLDIILDGAEYSFIGGGYDNKAGGSYAAVAGGSDNQATGDFATVAGGATNMASGQFSFAAGQNAQATNIGAFVWADAEGTAFTSTNTNSFNVRANGGVRFVTGGAGITVDGQPLVAGGGLTNGQAGVSLPGLTLSGSLNLDGANVNIYAGYNTLLYNDNKGNSFTGLDAGNVITTGSDNIASGAGALGDNTTGNENTATGRAALGLNRTGNYNTATGDAALYDNLGGSYNVAAGYSALYANSSGGENVAIGSLAMAASTADSGIVAVGYQALQNDAGGPGFLSIGSANTAVGYQSMQATTTGTTDTAVGNQSLMANTSGYNNTAVGNWALLANTSGYNNTVGGAFALSFNTTGNSNTAFGASALEATSTDSGLVAIGYGALQNDNAVNTGNTSSGYGENTAVGFEALGADTSGAANTAVGFEALLNNTSGAFNTATGHHALAANTTGSSNVAYGDLALFNNKGGTGNVAVGMGNLTANVSGSSNTAVGNLSLESSTGSGNTAVGLAAANSLTSGNYNTVIGDNAAVNLTSGNYNIEIGWSAGYYSQSGDNNIYIGNPGPLGFETGFIRIGDPDIQTQTIIAGKITGDGSGLTNVTASAISGPQNMALIPAGTFFFGDSVDGEADAVPPTYVTVSAFYMDINLVTYPQWQSVYFWATNVGYAFDDGGNGTTQWGVYNGLNKPVQGVNWFDCVKWCNARSEQAGLTPVYYLDNGFSQVYRAGDISSVVPNWAANGFRLPTEAEWEKAARGGLAAQRFPWGNVINENLANYNNNGSTLAYDLGGNTQLAVTGSASYPPNLYGLYDMGGNLFSWCWDWYAPSPFPQGSPYLGGADPRGPGTQGSRVVRSCGFGELASLARCANRSHAAPSTSVVNPYFGYGELGFRCVKGH